MTAGDIWIVYDGDCPFCSAYTNLLRLRASAGRIHLINAREPHPIVGEIAAAGLDLDEGMVLKMDGRFFHGNECIHRLALLSTPSNTFNRVNRWVFRRRWLTRLLYPVLRSGRNLTLSILGFKKLNLSTQRSEDTR